MLDIMPLPLFLLTCFAGIIFMLFLYIKTKKNCGKVLKAFYFTFILMIVFIVLTRIVEEKGNIAGISNDLLFYTSTVISLAIIIETVIIMFTHKLPQKKQIYVKFAKSCLIIVIVLIVLIIILLNIP